MCDLGSVRLSCYLPLPTAVDCTLVDGAQKEGDRERAEEKAMPKVKSAPPSAP